MDGTGEADVESSQRSMAHVENDDRPKDLGRLESSPSTGAFGELAAFSKRLSGAFIMIIVVDKTSRGRVAHRYTSEHS